jgi:hypothetical protein
MQLAHELALWARAQMIIRSNSNLVTFALLLAANVNMLQKLLCYSWQYWFLLCMSYSRLDGVQ